MVDIIHGQFDVLYISVNSQFIIERNFKLPLVLNESHRQRVMIQRIEKSSHSEISLAFGSVQMVK